ncbi:carboxypeptidase regulatory-like domain-containing protein [Echinicola strongylocentroti]|uniref:Carboxypeptidase regulatory-like domain-containing protein n=1 Tax=Echinicola strongylocentroti TaxID=1795355 RepID=A0A2Z4IHT5_9BACT|nr:carboxypeptidase-like regulatory domain-containing protein [Echinicola strongylocentroti]AWW30267.1 carboxypeptidase regulatory-like domain-containing protein [Echinicola strongylocentroti]
MSKKLRAIVYIALLGTVLLSAISCVQEDEPMAAPKGTITGTVTDAEGEPVPDVNVTLYGVGEEEITVTTESDGKYFFENVALKTRAVKFSKPGWLAVSHTINPDKYNDENIATADVSLVFASAKITGTIKDGKNGNVPLEGVSVSVGVAGTTTTGSDGVFTLESLIVDEYTVTFTKATYESITKTVSADDFSDWVVAMDITMGSNEILRGLTYADLLTAEKWYYNEYRGGRNADAYPRWDWACNYMSALDFRGAWQEQNEGTTLQIRNSEEDRSNPADLNVFDSYVYGSKMITEDNKILSLRVSAHNADEANPAYFGVQVIDMSAADPTAVKIGENRTYASGSYGDVEFDLSDYVGKEVIVAVGIYRQSTGDYWKQLVLRAIRFADRKVENWDWLPGNEVIDGWNLTQETVSSTMPHTKNSFTGISPISGNRDNYVDAYRAWREVDHVAANWFFVPLKKDPEVFPSEGYLIKTRNTPEESSTVPEAYLYSKFSVDAGSNQLTLSTRNFGDNFTYFKLTAIENDGTVTHLDPQSNTADEASAAADGCWKFKHGDGGAGNPEGYAAFVYDLSQFNGQDVTLALGVYNVEANTGENKLVIHRIDLN